jgi:hypothetical protein
MPLLLGLLRGLASTAFLKVLLQRIFFTLGLAAITYTGVNILMDNVKDQLIAAWSAQGADVIAVLSLANLDRALSVVVSALIAKLVMAGLDAAGSLRKIYWSGGDAPIVLN